MPNPIPIRNSAKAIIIKNGKLLAIQKTDKDGPWYLLPGGGQVPRETLHKALVRECKEEINVDIQIGELRFIREYISENHEFAENEPECHQIEFMFICEIKNQAAVSVGHHPDEGQESIQWLPLEKLIDYRLYPLSMRKHFMEIDHAAAPVYLGDVN